MDQVRSSDIDTADAGSGAGGSNGVGGLAAAGAAGTTGTGGSSVLPDLCKLPQVSGPCEAAIRAYWHNPATGVCEPFIYGGCQGNANRFDTLAACQAACVGASPGLDTCTQPADCTLASPGCCGSCDPVDSQAFVVINRTHLDDYSKAKSCNVSCGACAVVPPIERTSQYFIATCTSGRCAVLDIRESPLVSCVDNTECTLRAGAECCERCSSDTVVAISTTAKLNELVCGTDGASCPPCVAMIPPGFQAQCDTGKCKVVAVPVR